jgi:hypothetical protein
LDWDPVASFQRSVEQSQASFEEQRLALQFIKYTVDKYCSPFQGRATNSYTKNPVIQGSPGSGKSYLAQLAVVYCKSQGLRVISTAMMAARASVLGGVHLHKLLALLVNSNPNVRMKPMRCAELALEKIMRNPYLLYPLLTVDVLFLDEAGQVSAELLSVLDIILRTIRKKSTLNGGVLIISTMDHSQLEPINGTPFLLSTHILTSYNFVQLNHSVRASNDIPFQRFQVICRMNPYDLINNDGLCQEFKSLGRQLSPSSTTGMILVFMLIAIEFFLRKRLLEMPWMT